VNKAGAYQRGVPQALKSFKVQALGPWPNQQILEKAGNMFRHDTQHNVIQHTEHNRK
jgi:hypothetical protein